MNSINLEHEKKKNIRLALGIASLGVLGFFVMYIIFFVAMFFYPWTIFNLFPFPSLSKEVVGLDGNLLIFSEGIDFKGATYERPPAERMTLRIFNGKSLSKPEEIKSFSSLYSTEDKIYFFDKGLYRIFDGNKWEEVKNSGIGSKPKGAVGTNGIWALSKIKNKPVLNFITEKEIKKMPLPDDVSVEEIQICSTQILCQGDELHMFLEKDNSLFWYKYDGEKWNQPAKFEDSVENDALLYKDEILLFQSSTFIKNPEITLRVYRNNSWSEPKPLDIQGMYIETMPAVFKEKLIIFVESFFFEKYYVINGEKVSGPFNISKPFFYSINLWKIFFITLSLNLIFFILLFLLSFLIRKFKLKTWRIESKEYEFASLFRRSLAKYIDYIFVIIPASLPLYFVFKDNSFFDNPFKIMILTLYSAAVMILGSFFYHSLLEGFWGKTIGKKICGIVVLKDDFTKCNIWRGFLRNLMRIVDSFFYYLVAIVSMAGTMKWQRLGDIVAGTVVVRDSVKKGI